MRKRVGRKRMRLGSGSSRAFIARMEEARAVSRVVARRLGIDREHALNLVMRQPDSPVRTPLRRGRAAVNVGLYGAVEAMREANGGRMPRYQRHATPGFPWTLSDDERARLKDECSDLRGPLRSRQLRALESRRWSAWDALARQLNADQMALPKEERHLFPDGAAVRASYRRIRGVLERKAAAVARAHRRSMIQQKGG